MLRVVLSFFVLSVLSEALPPPPPPQNIHVDKWLLTWTPADTEEGKVTFTVEYSSFDSDEWHYVPACVHISSNSCDVTAISTKARHHCVRLRVQAERRGLNSSSVEACSQHSDTCTPAVRLTELPGSLIVPLNRKHDLAVEYGDHAGHRVYFRKEGTLQENFTDNVSTVSIPDLEEGQRYCVRIQYTYFDEPVGLPSCPRCVLVPRAVLSEALPPPPPPQNIHVDKWLLTWTPADTEEGKVTFTVEYSSFDSDEWHYVPACVHISSNSCDVTAISTKARHHCVRLRVQAERRGLNSSSVEACSQHSDTCTPAVRLTELPGSLIVPLNRKHDLAVEYGDHAGHRVYFRKEGTLQENFTDNVSTVSIPDLEEGQRYCVRIQYTYFDEPVGLPSCPRCVLVPRAVLSEALPPPPPPQNIHVDKWLLTWTPADTEEGKVTFTVEYSSFDSDEWHYVPACVHISSNSCDVTAISTKARHHCVRLRVQAERRGLNSSSVEACSQHSDTCTPAVRLTELPGSLIVPLNRKHDLAVEYGDHAGHRVYFRKEGTLQENFTDNVSTVSIPDLEEGQRYCVRIQYTYFDEPVGLPSCPRCVLVPRAEKDSTQTALIVSLVVVVVLVILVPLIAYILINYKEAFKECMRNPYEIPPHFLPDEQISVHHPPVNTSCCTEERCDVISVRRN